MWNHKRTHVNNEYETQQLKQNIDTLHPSIPINNQYTLVIRCVCCLLAQVPYSTVQHTACCVSFASYGSPAPWVDIATGDGMGTTGTGAATAVEVVRSGPLPVALGTVAGALGCFAEPIAGRMVA